MTDRLSFEQIQLGSLVRSKGILLGLLPLLIIIGALILKYLEGACGNDLILTLQEISVIVWGVELLGGILCIFNRRLRSFAISLILTLLLSAILIWPLLLLSSWLLSFASPPFCHISN